MSISTLAVSAVFLFGLMVGSFLNVCIWRMPADEQVVKGRSHCRSCGRQIAWYDNIPLLSFALLGGKCRRCKVRISWNYPFVELMTGLLFAGMAARFGWSTPALVYAVLGAALILVSMIDLREMILPDEITLPGLSLGVVVSFFVPELHETAARWGGLLSGVAGALVGSGVIYGVGAAGTILFRRKLKSIGEEEAMGFGDVKLMAMVGAVIGVWKVLLVNLVLAPVLGAVVGLALKMRTGRDIIPFGPFLALGTLIAIFWGDSIIAWYRNLLIGA